MDEDAAALGIDKPDYEPRATANVPAMIELIDTLIGSDLDGPLTNFVVLTPPVHGTLSGTAPNLTYLGATNYFGPDDFTFRTDDGSLTSAVATATITLINVNDAPLANPILFDYTVPYEPIGEGTPASSAVERVSGFQVLQVFDPLITPQRAESFNSGLYVLDAWKPRPNLTVNLGLRVDREDIDSSGYVEFDPRDERIRSETLWRSVCSDRSW